MTARMLSEPSRHLPPKLPNGLRWTNSQSAPTQRSLSQIRETTAPAAQPNTTAAMPKVSPIHNVPQPPDGTQEAFIRDWNLWLRNLATGAETQLTTDGAVDYGYATDNAGWKPPDTANPGGQPAPAKSAPVQ